MSDWADEILANSGLPSDDFTFTDGSNYLQDGFDFDTEMNEGVLQGARLPETKGMAELPDGTVTAFERNAQDDVSLVDEIDGLNLGAFIDETAIEQTASLADLAWLDPTQPQDPDRLPADPYTEIIPELEEAWGVNRRTDGISLVPNKDKEVADYELSLEGGPQSVLPGTEEARETVIKEVTASIRWALRQNDRGVPVQKIKQGLVGRLGKKAVLTRKAVKQIESERGLAGNVFIYAAAYPDIHKARTAKKLKDHVRNLKARYVVVPEGEQRLAVWRAIGKKIVTKVPWKSALRHYEPSLEAKGYKFASKGSAREILRRAFLSGPEEAKAAFTVKPKDVRPSERVGVQEALRSFRTAEAVPRQAIDNSSRVEEAKRKRALVQIAKWAKAGHLSLDDAHRLARSAVAPQMILRTAAMLVQAATAAPTAAYKGVGNHYKAKVASVSREAAWTQLEGAEAEMERKGRELEASRREKLGTDLNKMVKKGLLTREEAYKLVGLEMPVDEIRKLAAAAAQYKRAPKMEAKEAREYKGPLVTQAQAKRVGHKDIDPQERRIRSAAQKSGIKAKEFRSLIKWARIQMSEGTAGHEFDQLLRLRFSGDLLKAAKKLLKAARQEHEGLSGHVYVDAGAYASKRGIKGCEKGARTHRSGGIKAVLEIPQCDSCVLKNADNVCQAYNKPLVDEAPVHNAADYKKAAIKAANASDAEVTASLFAPSFDEGEYALTDPLQEISLDEAASPEELGEFLFGGMEL